MIHETRIQTLHDAPINPAGRYVLYWMQSSQRTQCNHALEHAIERADALSLPVVACFGLLDDYPEANARHYAFLIRGLADVSRNLAKRKIRFFARHGTPSDVILSFSREAALVVCDRGYMRPQKRWRDDLADRIRCPLVQVEADVVVPADEASDKIEFAARTIRPKIHRLLKTYLVPLKQLTPKSSSLEMAMGQDKLHRDIDVSDTDAALKLLKLDQSVSLSIRFVGGEDAAQTRLRAFIRDRLESYSVHRNEPSLQGTSMLAAYLHFGQIAPLDIALAVIDARDKGASKESCDGYLEELIVRRELAINFVHHCANYDQYDALPDWARKTLSEHRRDVRKSIYTLEQLEAGKTADPWWNAAQLEMTHTGFMHNYMRMYWGKKILEWTATPEKAFETVLYLNNKYFLCGRDPNAYTNVAWIFGLHDRPWQEREIFGKVRYMNAAGLQRKFDMDGYVRLVDSLVQK